MKYLLLALPILLLSCGGNESRISDEQLDKIAEEMVEKRLGPRKKTTKELSDLAIRCTKYEVTQRLKSPSTAEFNTNTQSTYINDTTYGIYGTVDSQNSFGAMIRTEFMCTVTLTNNGENYTITDFIIE